MSTMAIVVVPLVDGGGGGGAQYCYLRFIDVTDGGHCPLCVRTGLDIKRGTVIAALLPPFENRLPQKSVACAAEIVEKDSLFYRSSAKTQIYFQYRI